ncbi:hypothetical protein NITHO_2040002 [Nitrolancea hollandica Lb]|uniref:Uncharacterized protein n=1 Tax=Nitrolancea hollandica Lb TaxID=1129897 RepID=I4EEV9_9BACT|nr:hypothetical protein NITHO_2040002 [Nitrolancea hollandica Lb]
MGSDQKITHRVHAILPNAHRIAENVGFVFGGQYLSGSDISQDRDEPA